MLGNRLNTLVLCYHAISSSWDSRLAVKPERLEEQIKFLAKHGYRSVNFSEAVLEPSRERRVSITFDDACHSVYAQARPILEEAGFQGTVFVPTAYPESPDSPLSWRGIEEWLRTEQRDELLPMSWDEIRELRGAGWEIGSHTVNHPHLTNIGDEELRRELEESRERIMRELEAPCQSVAFPYGDTDARVERVTAEAGYTCAAALPGDEWSKSSKFNFPRVGIYRADAQTAFRMKIASPTRIVRFGQGWPLISRFARIITSVR